MYELFIGNYERVIGKIVYHKNGGEYIPCIATSYYFKSRKFALVPIEHSKNVPGKRRMFYTTKVYVRVNNRMQ